MNTLQNSSDVLVANSGKVLEELLRAEVASSRVLRHATHPVLPAAIVADLADLLGHLDQSLSGCCSLERRASKKLDSLRRGQLPHGTCDVADGRESLNKGLANEVDDRVVAFALSHLVPDAVRVRESGRTVAGVAKAAPAEGSRIVRDISGRSTIPLAQDEVLGLCWRLSSCIAAAKTIV